MYNISKYDMAVDGHLSIAIVSDYEYWNVISKSILPTFRDVDCYVDFCNVDYHDVIICINDENITFNKLVDLKSHCDKLILISTNYLPRENLEEVVDMFLTAIPSYILRVLFTLINIIKNCYLTKVRFTNFSEVFLQKFTYNFFIQFEVKDLSFEFNRKILNYFSDEGFNDNIFIHIQTPNELSVGDYCLIGNICQQLENNGYCVLSGVTLLPEISDSYKISILHGITP